MEVEKEKAAYQELLGVERIKAVEAEKSQVSGVVAARVERVQNMEKRVQDMERVKGRGLWERTQGL